jgi:hypothetical protein
LIVNVLNPLNRHFLARSLACIALLLTMCLVVAAQDDESGNTTPRTGLINGRVVNENGQPVPHAIVFVNAPMNPTQSRTTSSDDGGNFQISGLDALLYTLSASAPGHYLPFRDPDSLPTYYRLGDSGTITLIKGGVITGAVTGPNGEPLVQAGVRAILIRDANDQPPSPGRFAIDRPTDDRGVFRIYGLPTGTYIVAAGGRATFGYSLNAYDSDAPTYAPSSTRDTAAEISVRAGEETTVDIRYRGDSGHAVSGLVSGPIAPNSATNITLAPVVNGVPLANALSIQNFSGKGFAFYGVADGDYDLIAQSNFVRGDTVASEPRRITVKGADITGLELVLKGLASISGRVVFEQSNAAECKNKRQPSLAETMLVVRRNDKATPKDQLGFANYFAQGSPDQSGDFALRNLAAGQFNLQARFYAKYWYLRSIMRQVPGAMPARGGVANRQTDAARNGISLKSGERISGLTVTLSAGAASLRGAVKPAEGESLPAKLYLNLAPAEKESADDVLRFFTAPVNADGTFALNNLPPGRYWTLTRIAAANDPQSDARLRAPEEAETRTRIRRAAEAAKTVVEFKPCQNVIDYELPLKPASLKD